MIEIFKKSPVIPVLTFNDINQALKVSEVLIEQGLHSLEITLRTPDALKCIEAIIKKFPSANVGAGTIVNTNQLKQVKDIGCSFTVSPGFTKKLVNEAKKIDIFYLPGASTPSEIIQLLELDIKFQKFFHARNSGGYKMLQTYANIFPDIQFCPTGGINSNDFTDYLSLNNVVCLGGSWMVSNKDLQDMNYTNIKNSAQLIMRRLRI